VVAVRGRWIALVGGLALLVRIGLLSADAEIGGGDAPLYFRIANALLDDQNLGGNDFRTPGYPIAMLPALLIQRGIGGDAAELVLAGQLLVGIALAVALLLVGARYFGLWVGVAAGVLAAISPVLLTLERLQYPDLLYAALVFSGAAALAEGAIRDGERRWLVASGVVFGLAAWVKPSGEVFVVVPLLTLLISMRGSRRAWVNGALAAVAMVVVMAPWLIYNASKGVVGMSKEGDVTLFYRAFDYDRYPVPTDVEYGPGMRRLQLTHHSKPGSRLWQVTWDGLGAHLNDRDEALRVMGHAARVAIRRHAGTYLVRSADDARQAVGDLGATSPGQWEQFAYFDLLHDQLELARVEVPPTGVTWGIIKLGNWLGVAWVVITLYGLTALVLPFVRDPTFRAAGSAFLITWLVAAVTVALSHGALWRYSANIAPVGWLAGLAGAWLVWSAVARMASHRRALPAS
jgi:Dolichyl-phosphate-mannose-protein mannosyltransferase